MFTTEELDLLNKFFTVKKNLEDTLVYMDSKEKSNQQLLGYWGDNEKNRVLGGSAPMVTYDRNI